MHHYPSERIYPSQAHKKGDEHEVLSKKEQRAKRRHEEVQNLLDFEKLSSLSLTLPSHSPLTLTLPSHSPLCISHAHSLVLSPLYLTRLSLQSLR